LLGAADELTINFPWGSLLRGVLGHDDAVLAGVAALLAPRGSGSVLFSLTPRDGMPEPAGDLAAVYARHGLGPQRKPQPTDTDRARYTAQPTRPASAGKEGWSPNKQQLKLAMAYTEHRPGLTDEQRVRAYYNEVLKKAGLV